ncbi:hypothetical protein FW778_14530 [Ginsengibacter hankyongi]|uniref:Fibronectin type-III domain-containing protein n=1 Tax=Ginsengibacter hankyongi TaxID=2607284 RepID=A0A5J5IDF4_9BACT|nr:hypothetical protein [Ginsengibacter hankyongi]KAA9037982.1 hypothetical protein FW778_14530 [Ginsengibacter hankyongi]
MKTAKVLLDFSRYTDANFLQKSLYIITCMTGNPNFPTPVPPLTDVQAAYDTYGNALAAAAALGRQAVLDKNIAREALEGVLAQLGRYVMYVANGNESILGSSGFTLAKMPQPMVLDNPGNVILEHGDNPGELISQVPKQNGMSFSHQITDAAPTEDTVWTSHTVSTAKYTFTGLVPGKQYWVRVAVLGSRKQIKYSTVATQFASL